MTFSIHLTDEDYIRFNQFHNVRSKYGKGALLFFRLTLPVIGALMVLVTLLAGVDSFFVVTLALAFGIASVLWWVTARKAFAKNIRKTVLQMKKKGKLPYVADAELTVDETSLVSISEEQTLRLKLSRDLYTALWEDCLYIYYSPVQALIVPLSQLGADGSAVTEMLRRTTDFADFT